LAGGQNRYLNEVKASYAYARVQFSPWSPMKLKIKKGNFNLETVPFKGWVLGHFIDKSSPFYNVDFEIKWARHHKGEIKEARLETPARTLSILISGKQITKFFSTDEEVVLENEGDYLFYQPNVPHVNEYPKDTLLLVIRWPSIPIQKQIILLPPKSYS